MLLRVCLWFSYQIRFFLDPLKVLWTFYSMWSLFFPSFSIPTSSCHSSKTEGDVITFLPSWLSSHVQGMLWEVESLSRHCFCMDLENDNFKNISTIETSFHNVAFRYNVSQVFVAHAFNPSTGEAQVGRFQWVWGHLGLQSEFQHSRGYIVKLCLKKEWGWKEGKNTHKRNPTERCVAFC